MNYSFENHQPHFGTNVFVAPDATVLGQVELGDEASVWYGCVLRGDVGSIRIGARTNVQDLTVVHVTTGMFDVHVGNDVTIGHRAVIHGCTIGDRVLIGMGAVILDGAEIASDSAVAAGAVVSPGTKIPSGMMAMGMPAKPARPLRDQERDLIRYSGQHYVELAARHRAMLANLGR